MPAEHVILTLRLLHRRMMLALKYRFSLSQIGRNPALSDLCPPMVDLFHDEINQLDNCEALEGRLQRASRAISSKRIVPALCYPMQTTASPSIPSSLTNFDPVGD